MCAAQIDLGIWLKLERGWCCTAETELSKMVKRRRKCKNLSLISHSQRRRPLLKLEIRNPLGVRRERIGVSQIYRVLIAGFIAWQIWSFRNILKICLMQKYTYRFVLVFFFSQVVVWDFNISILAAGIKRALSLISHYSFSSLSFFIYFFCHFIKN